MEEANFYPAPVQEINGSATRATGANLTVLTAGDRSDASALHYHKGSISQGQTSKVINNTTTITIPHGLKVIPSLVTIVCMANIGTDAGGFAGLAHSYGTTDGTTQSSTMMEWEQNASNNKRIEQDSAKIIHLKSSDAASVFDCTASLDITNITLTVNTNTNSGGTRYIQWTAHK